MIYLALAIVGALVAIIVFMLIEERRSNKRSLPTGRVRETWSGTDRRRRERFDAALDVRYKVLRNGLTYGEAKTVNVSSIGLCLTLYERVNKNTLLEIMIEPPSADRLHIFQGQVVWVEEIDSEPATQKRRFKVGICIEETPELTALIDKIRLGNK